MALIALASSACSAPERSDEPASEQAHQSGSRLRARVHDGLEGALAFVGWHDTARDEPCAFETAGDGELRCLPSAAPSSDYAPNDVAYLDAACTTAVRFLPSTEPAVPRAVLGAPEGGDRCDPSTSRNPVREVGERVEGDAIHVFLPDATGACSPNRTVTPDQGLVLHRLGAEVPPSEFVAASRVVAQGETRLRAVVLRAEDGAREVVGTWDEERSEECSLYWDEPATCAPSMDAVAWSIGEFTDSACTAPVAYTHVEPEFRGCGAPYLGARGGHVATASGGIEFFELGASVDATHRKTGDSCVTLEEDPDHVYYEVGSPMLEGSFERVARAWLGGGRLQVGARKSPEGGRLDPALGSGPFRDTLAGTACVPVESCGAERLCEPGSAPWLFADAACSVPVVEVPRDPAVPLPELVSLRGPHAGCWNGELGTLGAVLTPRSLFQLETADTCVPYAFTPTTGYHFRQVDPSNVRAARMVERVE